MRVFTVELKNQPGELAGPYEAMAGSGINLGLSATARGGGGTVVFIADDETGAEAVPVSAGERRHPVHDAPSAYHLDGQPAWHARPHSVSSPTLRTVPKLAGSTARPQGQRVVTKARSHSATGLVYDTARVAADLHAPPRRVAGLCLAPRLG